MTTNNIPQGYKDSPLGIIPEEWEVKKLREIAEINPTRKDFISPFVTFLSMADISEHGGILKENIIPQNSIKPGLTSFKRGDIIIAKITPCFENGKGALLNNITNEYGFGSTEFHVIRCKQCNLFIYYHTMSYAFRKRLESQMTGSAGQKRVPADSISSYKIPVPPLSEQQKIAEVLSTWGKAIEKQSRLIEKLELRKKGLMQQLLTGKKRLPGFSSEWEEVKLWEIGTFFKGAGVPKDEISSSGAYKCLTYGDIYTKYNTQIKDVKCFISQETAKISKKIEYGDICFASSGETLKDIGKCAVFVDDNIGYAGGDIIIFRKNIKTNPILLAYILNSEYVNKQKYSVGQGHSVVHIYIHNLEKIKIKIPYIKEQSAITELLSYCDKEIKLAYQKLKILKQQKKGLMQVLLTGKKRIIQ